MGRGHGRVDGVDLIVEDRAEFVTDQPTLERVAEAYRNKYGWPLEIRDGQAHAPFGAPTAGPPPYRPYVITPRGSTAWASPTSSPPGPPSTPSDRRTATNQTPGSTAGSLPRLG